MNEILLYFAQAGNVDDDSSGRLIEFTILVRNLAFRKDVEVFWAGGDGVWKTRRAEYMRSAGDAEIWRAEIRAPGDNGDFSGGRVRFALRYRVAGREYWDNNNGADYAIEADSGLAAPEKFSLIHLGRADRMDRGRKTHPVRVALRTSAEATQVGVVWTRNGWKSSHTSLCSLDKRCPFIADGVAASHNGSAVWSVWTCELEVGDAFRAEYAIFADTPKGRIWDNNFGQNHLSRRRTLKVLTLNLHCYQEEDQDEKFRRIALAASDLDIDIICFQEVGERWNGGAGDWMTNAARIIREKLKRFHHLNYHLHADWSHIGFDRYREGCCILSRYKLLSTGSGYVSTDRSIYSIHARKVVFAHIHVPYIGFVNVFSVHVSWWSDGFKEQFERLAELADEFGSPDLAATLLCGDFNSSPPTDGYSTVVWSGQYEDQFLAATSPHAFEKVFRSSPPDLGLLSGDGRIDFIFMKKQGRLKAVAARCLFTEADYGRVSDHPGYMVEFEPF